MNIRVKGDTVEIEGYVNALERNSKVLKDRIGSFIERVKVGAFKRALERAEDVRLLLDHNWDRDLGGIKDGNLELHEDAIGLHARATITDKEVADAARGGKLRGWSFGFTDRDVDTSEENGITVREVKDMDLYEVSLIDRRAVPAYDGTLVCVRSTDERMNTSDTTEFEMNIRVEDEPKEEPKEDSNAPGAIDYTKYHDIINEMKGE